MVKLKHGSLEAKAVLQNVKGTAVSGSFELPPLFPGLPDNTECVLESEAEDTWTVQLIALGVPFTKIVVTERSDGVLLEEVK